MAEVSLPVYVHTGETELQLGVLVVDPDVSATVNLDPSALLTARQTIKPEPDPED
ncbi:hypothetical protein [Kibdelosporangium aridum]|uniref:hypothetical protein n=1 Tax=Kibdelosporangium aridum TaxID=2030 RepID=UPI000AFE29BA|nr:hypothetical protein [Kibdelosporangium aridum]